MSGGGGSSRVSIPNNVRKTIQDIREISGKQHSDDDIYAVLKECSMDPNETAQKLLYLDTFHEVRRRRDRKKEGLRSRAFEDSRSKQGGKGRGGRGAYGGYSYNFFDGNAGRNAANRKEIGVNHTAGRSDTPAVQHALEKMKSNGAYEVTRVSGVASSSHANQSNGSASHGLSGQSFMQSVCKSSAVDDPSKQENAQSHAAVAAVSHHSKTFSSITSNDQGKSMSSSDQPPIPVSFEPTVHSSSDSVLVPYISKNLGVGGAINGEVESQKSTDGLNQVNGDRLVLHEVGELPASKIERSAFFNSTNKKKTPNESNEVEENHISVTSQTNHSISSYNDSMRLSFSCGQAPPDELKQHVIVTFPNHFQVPEALKSGLTFGSFDSDFGKRDGFSRTDGDNNTSPAPHSSLGSDKTANSSSQSSSSTAQDLPEHTHSSSYLIKKPPVSEVNAISGAEPKQEVLLAPVGTPMPTILNAHYGLNFLPTMLGTQQVQFEGSEHQARETTNLPNFVSANSHCMSTPSPSPTPPLQGSIPISPQPISILRPHPNLFPYGHYYPPIYVSPIHQYLSHNGFPQQPSAGNMYLSTAAGIKFPLQQLKAGANMGSTTHIGIPPGSFISQPVGYAPSQIVNARNSIGTEDLAVSLLMENHIFTTGQLSEGSAMWMSAPGQEISSLQHNSLYNFNPYGHITFPQTQAAHAFAGLYQPRQMPSTLLQPSQAVAGVVETIGPPSSAY